MKDYKKPTIKLIATKPPITVMCGHGNGCNKKSKNEVHPLQ